LPQSTALGENLDKNISPIGWYVGSYIIRFIELNDEGNFDPDKRFTAWENTKLIKANNLDEAYDKLVEVAELGCEPYRGGPEGVPVQWVFEGVTELLPIYEELEDGSEIMYREHNPTKLKNLQKAVRKKHEFSQ
jgi:hypothetical protein